MHASVETIPASPQSTVTSDCSSRLVSLDPMLFHSELAMPNSHYVLLFFEKLWDHRAPTMVSGASLIALGITLIFLNIAFLGIPVIFTAPLAYGLISSGATLLAKGFYDSAELTMLQFRQDNLDYEDTVFLEREDLPDNFPLFSPECTFTFSEQLNRASQFWNARNEPPKPDWVQVFMQKLTYHRNLSIVFGLTLIIIAIGLLFLDVATLGVPAVLTAPIIYGLFGAGGTLVFKGLYDCVSLTNNQIKRTTQTPCSVRNA